MLENLIRLANNAKALNSDRIFFAIFSDPKFQDFIRILNLSDQLFEGIDSLGVSLDGYSPTTETILNGDRANAFNYEGKTKRKIAGEPIFLFDSGDFYESFNITVTNDAIILMLMLSKKMELIFLLNTVKIFLD